MFRLAAQRFIKMHLGLVWAKLWRIWYKSNACQELAGREGLDGVSQLEPVPAPTPGAN